MLAFHKQKKAEGTILVTKVSPPAAVGCDNQGQTSAKRSCQKHRTYSGSLLPALRLPRRLGS